MAKRNGLTALLISLVLVACARPLSQGEQLAAGGTAADRKAPPGAPREGTSDPRLAVLPTEGQIDGFAVTDAPRLYVGEALFDLINGGAVQFFNHGFEWAAAAVYRQEGDGDVTVEAYRMTSAAGARGVFEERAGGPVESARVGEEARIVHSSVEFRKGSFFVLVTAYETGQAGRDAAQELARIIEGRLPAG
jgi:hypothetical protein